LNFRKSGCITQIAIALFTLNISAASSLSGSDCKVVSCDKQRSWRSGSALRESKPMHYANFIRQTSHLHQRSLLCMVLDMPRTVNTVL
jgi:hypothetical protein